MMNDKIVWLASYPKTGSTWLRIIAQQIIAPEMAATEAIPSFQKTLPENIPQHDILGTRALFLKTHCSPDSPRMDQIRAVNGECIGVISIYRHPLDVMLSSINYLGMKGRSAIFKDRIIKPVEDIIKDGDIEYYIDSFIENDGIETYFGSSGPWSQYQEKWDSFEKKVPYLRLCYEDMVSDPKSGISKVFEFLRKEGTEERINQVYERSESKTKQDGRFYWKKMAFNFTDLIPHRSTEKFIRAFEKPLRYLGYSV